MKNPIVSVIVGSDSDLNVIRYTCDTLNQFGVRFDLKIFSAHRTPELLKDYIKKIEKKGVKVIIGAAGFAAHLPGVIASYTTLPVIGVPLDSSSLNGLDSLLAMVQMPSGIPVLTITIGKAGAINAALAAIEILSINNKSLCAKLKNYRGKKIKRIKTDNSLLEKIGYQKFLEKKSSK